MSLSELIRGWLINPILAAIEELEEKIMSNNPAQTPDSVGEEVVDYFPLDADPELDVPDENSEEGTSA